MGIQYYSNEINYTSQAQTDAFSPKADVRYIDFKYGDIDIASRHQRNKI